VDFAAQTDMLEANLGQLAGTQASSQGVKDYAQMLVTDHTDDYTQLGVVAGKDNLVVPKALDAAHDKMIALFKNLQVYTKEATDAQSADLKAYANQTLATLQKHLDGAKNLAKAKPFSKSM
jgi:putative membrane protein